MSRRSISGRLMAERRFPIRVRVSVPPGGFGAQLNQMHGWLDAVVGRDGYAVWGATKSGPDDP